MFKVKNNFFKKNEFIKMKYIITHPNFNWFLQTPVVDKDNCIYFSHIFFNDNKILSPFYKDIIMPFVDKLKIKKLLRSKLNLYPKTHKQIIHGFHTDRKDKHNVILFYFNTNNGQTLFKNKKINSKENKIVVFDGSLEHSSTTCTDQNYRITLNINYEL
tara:strand:- start:14 stop:490 length:477 start_codon:yes stop_codon:yes gene_type:complete